MILSAPLFGQPSISNNVTNRHTRVDGTNIYLVFPDGFSWMAQSREFINSKINASIIINAIETTIDQVHREMSKDVLLSQGAVLLSDKPIKVNNLKGYLIETKRQTFNDKFLSYTLMFGKDRICYVVQIIFPESDDQFAKQSYQIINSVVYKDVIPNSNKKYSMDFGKYSFGLIESKNNIDYYQSGNNTSISIEQFFTKGNTDPGVIFYTRMQRLPFTATELNEKGIEEIEINNLNCLHAVLKATNKDGELIYVYQLLLNDGDNHYLILGAGQTQTEILRTIELAKTFKKID